MTKEPYINVKKVRTQLWRVELTSTTGKSHTIEGTRKFIIDAILNYLYPSGIRPLKER